MARLTNSANQSRSRYVQGGSVIAFKIVLGGGNDLHFHAVAMI
jgi:hypothetical protein